jgi:hypothetical protein
VPEGHNEVLIHWANNKFVPAKQKIKNSKRLLIFMKFSVKKK